jgi:hypothetical protein
VISYLLLSAMTPTQTRSCTGIAERKSDAAAI